MKPHVRFLATLSALFAVCLVLPIFKTVEAQRSQPVVEAVDVVGNRRLSAQAILTHVKTQPGEPFSFEQCKRDLEELLALGVFDKLETRVLSKDGVRGGVVVTFEVVELPLLSDVKFSELRGIDESKVLRVLSERGINLVKDAIYDPLKVRVAKGILQELLASNGWPNAVITVRSEIDGSYVSVEFEIRYKD